MKYLNQICFVCMTSAVIQIQSLNATDFTFNVLSGDWQTSGNWTPPGPPANTTVDTATIGSARTAIVQSSSVPLDQARSITVGDATGSGTVGIIANGTLTSGNADLAIIAGETGTVTVNASGGTALWNNNAAGGTGLINVGLNGRGVLSISNGGQVNTTNITTGVNLGSFDSLITVTGTGSTLNISNIFILGNNDKTTLQVLNGGTLTSLSSSIATTVNSVQNTATVDGIGSLWNNNGTLTVGNQGEATLNIQNGGQVNAASIQVAVLSSISGFGRINLSGSNSLLNTGPIQGGTGDSFLNLNGGILQTNASYADFITNISQVTFDTNGAIIDSQAFTISTGQSLTGSGPLTKQGSGTLILTGANTLTGTTTISAGTLNGNTGSLPTGNVTNQGILIFDQAAAGTFAGSISGNGALQKQNVGNLTLTGTNSYIGGTTIATGGGILTVNTNSLPSGSVVNNATLVFNQAVDGTYAGNISGTGTFMKENSGRLILSGVNSYQGLTTINGGILQGNTISIPSSGGVLNNASLVFDQSFLGLFGGAISGSGSLTKQNSGRLILGNTNTYAGGTIISAGSLEGDTDSIPSTGGVLNNGSLIFDQSFNATFSGNITGSGSLTKQNSGSLILTGTNTYAGGTTITDGVLQGNTASLPSGTILNDSSLIFDQASNGTFTGDMSGTGSFTKINAGTLILAGNNSYSGGTTVDAGVLQGDSASLQGTLTNHATIIFDQSFSGTYAGSITGSGSLTKEGVGKLQFTGDSSGFSGNTIVSAGNLNVNGSLGGSTTIALNAILSGQGFLVDVTNNGTIAPGNSIGTLHVVNFINGPTGTYQAEINSSGASSLIAASGTAVLNGGTLVVTAAPGFYVNGTTFTLIDAAGGLTGTFATTSLPTNVPLVLSYLANSLILTVQGNTFDISGLRGNALRTALYIRDHLDDPDPDFLTVVDALSALPFNERQEALDQLHPALFEALALTVGDTTHMINSTFIDRLAFLRRNNCCHPSYNPCACTTTGFWSAGTVDFIRQSRTEGLRRFTSSNQGLAFGFDNNLCQSVLAGIGAGYSHTNMHWGNAAGHAYIDGYYLGTYATKYNEYFYIDGSILTYVNQHHVRRHIHFDSIDRKAKNRHYSYGFNPHVGAGLYLNYCTLNIIPFFDLDYYLIQQNRVNEHGADSLNLHVKRNQTNLLRLETGLNFSKCYQLYSGQLLPNLSISYVAHRLLSGKKYISSFSGLEDDFSVFGTNYCFNQIELGAGLMYIIDDSLALNSWYDIELGHQRQEQEVNLEINYRF